MCIPGRRRAQQDRSYFRPQHPQSLCKSSTLVRRNALQVGSKIGRKEIRPSALHTVYAWHLQKVCDAGSLCMCAWGACVCVHGARVYVCMGRAATGGALAPEPPRATRNQPESILIRQKTLFPQNF